ncbi:MAG TPA: hypothetical protein VMT18_09055 [Planctomycetota bacterium]|nr:hypothetical protein [Planctomycetota bacterium]
MRSALANLVLGLMALACAPADPGRSVEVPGQPGRLKSSAIARAARRAYDGAPPVIPHAPFGAACTACHGAQGMEVEGLGFAPPSPHAATAGMGHAARCQQCHVFQRTDEVFVASGFRGLAQDLRTGRRLHPLAPPVMPHPVFMRENCSACHDGPAAREEIRTSHPERARCNQCHVEQVTNDLFARESE